MEPYCYFDGKVIPVSQAHVRPDDLGMLRGFAVYEGITAVNGVPFHFHEHWMRLEHSAAALGLRIPHTKAEVEQGLRDVLSHNAPTGRASIRAILSGGPALGGIEYDPANSLFYALAEPAAQLPASWYEDGASLVTEQHERFMPEYKTTGYITAVLLQKKRKDAAACEILYVANGNVLECATSNIFIVRDGVVITPCVGILKGITRMAVMDLASPSYTVEERPITLEELMAADEVFITSSFKDIVPIVSVDGISAGGGVVGPVSRELIVAYQDLLTKGG